MNEATTACEVPGEGMLKLMYTNGPEVTTSPSLDPLTLSQLAGHLISARQGISVALLSADTPMTPSPVRRGCWEG